MKQTWCPRYDCGEETDYYASGPFLKQQLPSVDGLINRNMLEVWCQVFSSLSEDLKSRWTFCTLLKSPAQLQVHSPCILWSSAVLSPLHAISPAFSAGKSDNSKKTCTLDLFSGKEFGVLLWRLLPCFQVLNMLLPHWLLQTPLIRCYNRAPNVTWDFAMHCGLFVYGVYLRPAL